MNDMSGYKRFAQPSRTGKFAFVLMPRFSLLALAGTIEPLRHANHVLGEDHYSWPLFSEDGNAVLSSSGVPVSPSGSLKDVPLDANVILVGGADVLQSYSPVLVKWLRHIAVRVGMVGGLCTATRVLAEAGLLDGHRATIHWEMYESMREAFPDVELSDRLYEVDRNRMTCAGEAASTDMILNFLMSDHGKNLAAAVAAQVLHGRVRSPEEPQAPLAIRTGIRNKYLLQAIALMERHQDDKLDIEQIAERAGCSRRQLERLFQTKVGLPPVTYYRNLRLDRARQLFLETDLSLMEISIACGFANSSTMSLAYKRRFGRSPTHEEKLIVVPARA
ncbi:MAG: GlxA family transcriptional regulator [Rhizobiales bacterium]|nr:GlxA family transcriptional regulator [Hyphomicrobiales bacterium]